MQRFAEHPFATWRNIELALKPYQDRLRGQGKDTGAQAIGEIMDLFQKLNESGKTIVFVTHEPDIARLTSRNIVFRDGHVISELNVEDRLMACQILKTLPVDDNQL